MWRMVRVAWHLLAVAGLAALAGSAWMYTQGIGARATPHPIETAVARTARHYAIPASARGTLNPVPASPEAVRDGMLHWADHCASCHGNDGSGDTEMGRGLYPKAPDMRAAATQSLSDGELFYIIEHGVRLTGMPAWATGSIEGEQASWRLVHFIRHLPSTSDDEVTEMQQLNPRGVEDWRQLDEERKFLEGDSVLSGDLRLGSSDHEHDPPKGPHE
jgi:mono/diheme cytochrome c family protein